jgi:hypothetical protein
MNRTNQEGSKAPITILRDIIVTTIEEQEMVDITTREPISMTKLDGTRRPLLRSNSPDYKSCRSLTLREESMTFSILLSPLRYSRYLRTSNSTLSRRRCLILLPRRSLTTLLRCGNTNSH